MLIAIFQTPRRPNSIYHKRFEFSLDLSLKFIPRRPKLENHLGMARPPESVRARDESAYVVLH